MDSIKKMREERGGFTLAELLIVVAIILVLVAIAIPVFTGALDKANDAVKNADMRSVKAAAVTKILLDESTDLSENGTWKAEATVDGNGNIDNVDITPGETGKDSATKSGDGYKVVVYIKSTDIATTSSTPGDTTSQG